jgi:hypothetical protein
MRHFSAKLLVRRQFLTRSYTRRSLHMPGKRHSCVVDFARIREHAAAMRYLDGTPDAWLRVINAVEAARPGMLQQDLATELDVSTATLRKMRSGEQTRFDRGTLNRIAARLGWPQDAVQRLLNDPQYDPNSQAERGRLGAGLDPVKYGVPAAFSAIWSELSEEDRAKVLGYAEARRDASREGRS